MIVDLKKRYIPHDLYQAFTDALRQQGKEHMPVQNLPPSEAHLVWRIKELVRRHNLNNVTRTSAYADFYWEHQDIHWAFLAHMVSRNGGWNMTDLQGELISQLLNQADREAIFNVLERCNWLIFRDAYPQLLLYEESKRKCRNLFHLLPFFGVSSFMRVIWDYFWQKKEAALLTLGLIINEQNYIEERVIQNLSLEKGLQFQLQDVFRLNVVFFPYELKTNQIQLAGVLNHDFTKLDARIKTGKALYAILFQKSEVYKGAFKWAKKTAHSGSRHDFWPWFFTTEEPLCKGGTYEPRIKNKRITAHAPRISSPALQSAWPDMVHHPAGGEDWFHARHARRMIKHLQMVTPGASFDCTDTYTSSLETLELGVAAKTKMT